MKRALAEFKVVGVATNIPYLAQIIDHPDFVSGDFDTGFLDRHQVFAAEPLAEQQELAEIASLLLVAGREADHPDANGATANGHRAQKASEWRARMTGMAATKAMGRWPKSM
jgi:pyruvate carboxylase